MSGPYTVGEPSCTGLFPRTGLFLRTEFLRTEFLRTGFLRTERT